MPYFPSWDENDHADLTSVRLKGKFLDEFIWALNNGKELMKQITAANHYQDTTSVKAVGIVFKEIGERLSDPQIRANGINYREFKSMIEEFSAAPTFDYQHSLAEMDRTVQEGARLQTQALADTAENAMGGHVLGLFSAALALQEDRLQEYKNMIDQFTQQQYMEGLNNVHIVRCKESETERDATTRSLFARELVMLQELNAARGAGVHMQNVYEYFILGEQAKNGLVTGAIEDIRNNVAALWDIDLETQAGIQTLRNMEKSHLVEASRNLNLPLHFPPDTGGRVRQA